METSCKGGDAGWTVSMGTADVAPVFFYMFIQCLEELVKSQAGVLEMLLCQTAAGSDVTR